MKTHDINNNNIHKIKTYYNAHNKHMTITIPKLTQILIMKFTKIITHIKTIIYYNNHNTCIK